MCQKTDMEVLPVIPECEVFHEGGPNALQLQESCQKNPGHTNFIPIKELTLEHLPSGYQTQDVLKQIKHLSNKTVKVTVTYTSPNRPDTYPNSKARYPYSNMKGSNRVVRCGTGVFTLGPIEKEGHCPCTICKRSNSPAKKYLLGVVSTAAHVVFDEMEARFSSFEMFYDCESSSDHVKLLSGVGLFMENLHSERNQGNFGNRIVNDDTSECCVGGSTGRSVDVNADIGDCGSSVDGKGCVRMRGLSSDFYNNDEVTGVIKRCHQDRVWVACVTHDLKLAEILEKDKHILVKHKRTLPRKFGVIVSHPHGLSKRISFGPILQHRYPLSPGHPPDVPYTFGPGVKCRISKQCHQVKSAVTALKMAYAFQQFLNLEAPLKLGFEYKLKNRISVLVPPNAVFLSESVFQKGCADYWVTFHPGTKFAVHNGMELTYTVLPNAEFNFFDADFTFYTGLSYATYAIDTCPGCSGAEVMFNEIKEFHGQHSGALGDGTNRSALDFY